MAGGKLPPRQKMIGMMYLVLTALLAMNVSKDILSAFVIVNEGLERTNENFGKKNSKTYADLSKAMKDDPAKAKPYHDRAMQVKKLSKELVEYIEKLKIHLVKETDKIELQAVADTTKLANVNAKDNYDKPTEILIGSEPAAPKTGEFTALELKGKIEAYKTALKKFFADDKDAKFLPGVKKDMETKIDGGLAMPDGVENGVPAKWEIINFYHLPIAGVVTNLSAIQASVQNAEADAIQTLLASIKGLDFTFDRLEAKVIAPSSYLIQGEEYKADVLLVASNSTSSPDIFVCPVDTTKGEKEDPRLSKGNPGQKLTVEGGVGKYKVGTGSTGEQKWSGVIQVKDAAGGIKYYPFASSYVVAPPALVVSPTKMNVFYIGVDNPVDISVPGYANDNVVPNPSGCTLVPDPTKKGSYLARCVTGTKEASVSVSVKQGGSTKPLQGAVKFRVKSLPNPVAKVAGKRSGDAVSKALLAASQGVAAVMEGFEFDLRVSVSSFSMVATVKGETAVKPATGNKFTPEQLTLINSLKANSRVTFEDIKVRMPDGSVRTLDSITLKISG
jgi:gliding motility-associated protein GldM